MLERVQNKLGLRLCFRMHFILFYATKRYFMLLCDTVICFMLQMHQFMTLNLILMHLMHFRYWILLENLFGPEVFTPSKAKNLPDNRHKEIICRF